MRDLVGSFLQTTPEQVAAVEDARDSRDPDALAAAAHRLRGGCLAVGALPLSHAAGEVEQLVREGRPDDAAEAVDEVLSRWVATQAALSQRIASRT
jgi:HPt (histidine-containing phosphotransfer) domain-containing protein